VHHVGSFVWSEYVSLPASASMFYYSRQVSDTNRKNSYKNLCFTQDEIILQALK